MQRFIYNQKLYFNQAYQEIKAGRKMTHWIWFIFPQIKGLGYSENSQYFGIQSLNEAKEYLYEDILRNNLIKITSALLEYDTMNDIFDSLDCQKILSCMTLFNLADDKKICGDIFKKVIKKFFNGKQDEKTLEILGIKKPSNYHYSNYNNYYGKYQNDNYDNYNDITSYHANYKRYPENTYKGQYIIEANNNNNNFDYLKRDNKNINSFNYYENQLGFNQNNMKENLMDKECGNHIYVQNEINMNYNERRNSSERNFNTSNIGNVKIFDNFNRRSNDPKNDIYENMNNFKNNFDHQKTNIKGPINRGGRSSSLCTGKFMRKTNFK